MTIENVPEVNPEAIERSWLCEAEMVTTCAPSHALASAKGPIPADEFGLHIQVVVTDNQPEAEKTQQGVAGKRQRSEEHTSELQSLMRISYAVFCLKKKRT